MSLLATTCDTLLVSSSTVGRISGLAPGYAAAITSLRLHQFRNYTTLELELEAETGCVVLTGANGAGKTNILEALSLFAPGRGLRSATLAEMGRRSGQGDAAAWTVAAGLACDGARHAIGTARQTDPESGRDRRRVRINGEDIPVQTALTEWLSLAWLTPQMDGLFIEGASIRRHWLDRMAAAFHPQHAASLAAYDRQMRERNRLLAESCQDTAWLNAVEQRLAGLASGIAAARLDTADRLNAAMIQSAAPVFPQAELDMNGEVEDRLRIFSATETEAWLEEEWRNRRRADALTGKMGLGTHRSDIVVVYTAKNMLAAQCSTGEQKALMLSVTLAQIRAKRLAGGAPPILLLDETVAHLDAARRAALFDEIAALGAQAWMTGTESHLFEAMCGRAEFWTVTDGKAVRHPA